MYSAKVACHLQVHTAVCTSGRETATASAALQHYGHAVPQLVSNNLTLFIEPQCRWHRHISEEHMLSVLKYAFRV